MSLVVGACGLKAARMGANEASAMAMLRMYLGAQSQFHRADRYRKGLLAYANPKDGTGFGDLYRLPDGKELGMIDARMAQATSPEKAKSGYYFVDIAYKDYSIECGLCAVPARYGATGRNTFIIDVTGVTYQKDNGGKPVTTYPDLNKGGWLLADM